MQSMYLTRRCAAFLAAVCALACAFLASCGGGDKGDGAVRAYGIVIVDNAALRVDPLIYSARISLLKKGDKLEIIDQSKGKSTIGKNRDYWYKVRQRRGLSGWIYGANLKLFSLGTGYSMDSYIARLKEKGAGELRKNLAGKWWSVDSRGDFTSHCIELFEDGKYKSYYKGGNEIEGEYDLNFKDDEIVFKGKTSFGSTGITYVARGNLYYLELRGEGTQMRFKKISEDMEDPSKEKETGDDIPKEPVTGEEPKDKNQ